MIWPLALRNPQVTAEAARQYNTPGQVDTQQLRSSIADFAVQTLACYHKSARFRGVSILGAPWRQQGMFAAENSVVLRINFAGISGSQYHMVVAAMAKGQSYRTFVIQENSLVPYNKHCALESWTDTSA